MKNYQCPGYTEKNAVIGFNEFAINWQKKEIELQLHKVQINFLTQYFMSFQICWVKKNPNAMRLSAVNKTDAQEGVDKVVKR